MSNSVSKSHHAARFVLLLLLAGCSNAMAQNAPSPEKSEQRLDWERRRAKDLEIERQEQIEEERKWPAMQAKLEAYAPRDVLERLHKAKVSLGLEENDKSNRIALPYVGASVHDSEASDEVLALLGKVKSLKQLFLDIDFTSKVTDEGLQSLAQLKELQSLMISCHNEFITPSTRVISTLPNLTSLYVRGLTDSDVYYLQSLKKLKTLSLRLALEADVDKVFEYLSKLSELRELYFGESEVNDRNLAFLVNLPHIEVLPMFRGDGVTDAGLESLSHIETLKRFSVKSKNVTDAGLSHLKKLPALQSLNLQSTSITDEGLKHLSHISSLNALYITDAHITDAGLQHLENCKSLAEVVFSNTKVSEEGIKQLRSKNSKLRASVNPRMD